jgi:amidophosphoribosyltransferase
LIAGLKSAGAQETHVRIGCPPLIAPCYLGIDMRSKKEFIARDKEGNIKTWEQIAKEIGADSLAYNSIEMQEDVIGLFKKDRLGIRAYETK